MFSKLIDIFLATARPFHKVGIVVIALFVLVLVDQFTSYPSLSFTKEKYETIKVLNEIIHDSTINAEVRKEAEFQIVALAGRNSLRDFYSSIFSSIFSLRNINITSIKAHISPPIEPIININVISVIAYILSIAWYIICCTCFWLFVSLIVISDIRNNKGNRRNNYQILFILTIVMVVNVLLITVFLNVAHIESQVYLSAFMSQLLIIFFLFMIAKYSEAIYKRYKIYKRDKELNDLLNNR